MSTIRDEINQSSQWLILPKTELDPALPRSIDPADDCEEGSRLTEARSRLQQLRLGMLLPTSCLEKVWGLTPGEDVAEISKQFGDAVKTGALGSIAVCKEVLAKSERGLADAKHQAFLNAAALFDFLTPQAQSSGEAAAGDGHDQVPLAG